MTPEQFKTTIASLRAGDGNPLSDAQIADLIGVSATQVSNYKAGRTELKGSALLLFMAYLDGYRPLDRWPNYGRGGKVGRRARQELGARTWKDRS